MFLVRVEENMRGDVRISGFKSDTKDPHEAIRRGLVNRDLGETYDKTKHADKGAYWLGDYEDVLIEAWPV